MFQIKGFPTQETDKLLGCKETDGCAFKTRFVVLIDGVIRDFFLTSLNIHSVKCESYV
jgi:hypothetical protein